MKKSKHIGICLLSAMTLGQMKAPLSAKQDRFLINGTQIQKQYRDKALLSFQVEEDEKDMVKLYVKDDSLEKQQITEIRWIKNDHIWIGEVEVMDGDELQYELVIDEECYETPLFSKDSTACSMKLFEDGKEVGYLQDTYQKNTQIIMQFYDPHIDHVDISIIRNGDIIDPIWLSEKEKASFELENGEYRIHVEMVDQYGNMACYDKQILVDDSLPEIDMLVNQQPYTQQVLETDAYVELMISDEHLDLERSFVKIDGCLQEITWESDGKKQKTTFEFTQEGVHIIECNISDQTGNTSMQQYVVCIDKTPPIVMLQEQGNPMDEIKQIYDHPFHLQMKIEETSLDPKESYVVIDGEKRMLS